MLPSILCSQARRIAAQRLEADPFPWAHIIYPSGFHPMPFRLPAGLIDGRFHRRTYLSSCSTYGIGQVAGKTDLLLREA